LLLAIRLPVRGLRRELRLNALVEAWRSVERAVSRGITENASALARALADLQLFGSPRQAHQAATAAEAIAEGARDMRALDELLEALRVDLRSELHLGRIDGRLVHLRRVDKDQASNRRRAEATAARPDVLQPRTSPLRTPALS
jgi:hypothetical protein